MTPAADIRIARSRRSRALLGALVAGGALAAAAAPALAAPADPNDPLLPNGPINITPTAALTVNPEPAVIPRPIVVSPTSPLASPVLRGTTVTFNASGSRDLDGSIVKYEWDVDGVPGFEATTATPTITRRYTTTGTSFVGVRVTDNRGATATATRILRRHHAPIARIATSRTVALPGDGITFDAGGSTDDGTIVKYAWDLDGNGTYERNGVQVSTSFGAAGAHTVGLQVTDNLGAVRTATTTVRVHRAPTAVIVTRPLSPVAGQPVTLDGGNSTDDGSIARYEWDLDGDGTYETDTAATPTTTTTFPATGPVRVGLRVTDNDGATDASTLQLNVADRPAPDTTAPRLTPTAKRIKMDRKGRVNVRLRCPATEQMCVARIQLRGVKRPLAGRLMGSARITLPGGRALNATVKLSPAAQRAIRKAPVRTRVVVTATDAAGNRAVTRTLVTIRK